jgi:hypothetical protein
MKYRALLFIPCVLSGCATGTGIVPVGPNTYTVSEMRAPALGGGPEAERAVLAESNAFCAAQGRIFAPVAMHPDGDPFTPYYPTAYDAIFQCLPQEATAQPQPPKP